MKTGSVLFRLCLFALIATVLVTSVTPVLAADKTPSLTITSPPNSATLRTTQVVIAISTDNAPKGATYQYYFDGSPIKRTPQKSIRVTGIASGTHVATVEMLTSAGQPLTPRVSDYSPFQYEAPDKQGKVSKDALTLPSFTLDWGVQITATCSSTADDEGRNNFHLEIKGKARVPVGGSIALTWSADAGPAAGKPFPLSSDQMIFDAWHGTSGTSKVPTVREPDDSTSTDWHTFVDFSLDSTIRTFKVGIIAESILSQVAFGLPRARTEVTCTAPQRVKITSVNCETVRVEGDRRSYQLTVKGSASGPTDALVFVAAGTDPGGRFTATDIQSDWEFFGFNAEPSIIIRGDKSPDSTDWTFVARSALLDPAPLRDALAVAYMVDSMGHALAAGRLQAAKACAPQKIEDQGSPRVDLGQNPNAQPNPPSAGGPLRFAAKAPPPADAGKEYLPNGQRFSFCDPPTLDFTTPCPPPGTVAGNPSGGNPPYHFQLGTGGGFPPLGMALGKDGQLTGTPATATGGRSYNFSVCAIDLSANSVCQDVSIFVNSAPTPTPTPTRTPTPIPTRTPTVTPVPAPPVTLAPPPPPPPVSSPASLTVSPSSVAAGGQVTVFGQGFTPFALGTVTLAGIPLAYPSVGSTGGFTTSITVPAFQAAGIYVVTATDVSGKVATATLIVSAAPQQSAQGAASITSITCTGSLISRNLAGSNNLWQFRVTATGSATGPSGTVISVVLFPQYVHVYTAPNGSFSHTSSWQENPRNAEGFTFTRRASDPATTTWTNQIVWGSLYVNNETETVRVSVSYTLPGENSSRAQEMTTTCRAA